MPRASSPSFILELPLQASQADQRALAVRLDAARQVYNAALGEALRILALLRESKSWQRARRMPKGPERSAAFKAASDRLDFKSSMADRFAIRCKNACWIGQHLSSNETQKTALRAFKAVQQHAFGKRGKPRFKRVGELFSIEGKTNAAGIRFKDGVVEWASPQGSQGPKLRMRVKLAPYDAWQRAALARKTKYCRLLRREIRGRLRWYVQLVQEGHSPATHTPREGGVVGLDIGPSTIAVVSDLDASLERFCPSVEQPWRQMRRLQRAMDRSRRATNPENYNVDGTVKRGQRWKRSCRYKQLAAERKEGERCLAAERKRSHGELANRVLGQGRTVKTEKLSYRSFQKCFGRSVKVRGPGQFVAMLRVKAKVAGGELVEFPTKTTRLSQYDHTTGDYVKKPLSQRVHVLRDGSGQVQRDLYSAFLARHVSQDGLDARKAVLAFPAAKPLLSRAASSVGTQPARGNRFSVPHVASGVRAGRPRKEGQFVGKAADVVPARKRPGGLRRADKGGRSPPADLLEPPAFMPGEV